MISKLLAKLMCNALPLLAFFPLLGNSVKGLIPFQTQTPEPAAEPYSGLGGSNRHVKHLSLMENPVHLCLLSAFAFAASRPTSPQYNPKNASNAP